MVSGEIIIFSNKQNYFDIFLHDVFDYRYQVYQSNKKYLFFANCNVWVAKLIKGPFK